MKNRNWIYVFRLVLAIYTALALYYFLGKPAGGEDESLFIADLQFIDSNGWVAAIKKGVSIPYMILAYPLAQLMEGYIALRLVNLLLFGGLCLYFFKSKSIRSIDFYLLLLFFFNTVGYFLSGINDTLFIVGLSIFLVETYYVIGESKKGHYGWLFGGLIVAFFTRFLILAYTPILLFSLFLILKKKRINFKQCLVPLILLVVFTTLNVPSLSENNKLSYDQKLPPANVTASWPQRQYYAQLLVNEGALPNHNHPSWKQTDAYLTANGSDSLPEGILGGMTFNWQLTLKEFFKDLFDIALYGSRQLGLMLPIVFIFGMVRLFRNRKVTVDSFVPIVLVGAMCIFALIIISFVELRWLASVFIPTIFYFFKKTKDKSIPEFWTRLNYIILTLISIYGSYGLILKM